MTSPFDRPEKPYVVELSIAPFAPEKVVYKGFDTKEQAEAFMDRAKKDGLVIGPLTVLPNGIFAMALHSEEGIVIRPGAAKVTGKAKLN